MDRYATRQSVRNLIPRYFVSPVFLLAVAITLPFVLNSKTVFSMYSRVHDFYRKFRYFVTLKQSVGTEIQERTLIFGYKF